MEISAVSIEIYPNAIEISLNAGEINPSTIEISWSFTEITAACAGTVRACLYDLGYPGLNEALNDFEVLK